MTEHDHHVALLRSVQDVLVSFMSSGLTSHEIVALEAAYVAAITSPEAGAYTRVHINVPYGCQVTILGPAHVEGM